MRIGLIRTSKKENERRIPIYPEHLGHYPEMLRKEMVFEKNYGIDYGVADEFFIERGASIAERNELLKECDLVVLPKPMPEDLSKMSNRQVLFGWPHSVQQKAIAQLAIEREITVIAWEAMHHWSGAGEKLMHVFYKNNELAGYAAVLHCLQLLGIDGHYGPRRKVVVLSYGSVSRGAIYALQGRGFNNIHVYTQRKPHQVADQNPDVYYGQYYFAKDGMLIARDSEGQEMQLIDELSSADIICNGILQDTNKPITFIAEHEITKLKPRSIIIDISCDEGMGFSFARATSFKAPVFQVGENITYYSVDHTPTYLWSAASREISKALLPYLAIVAAGEKAWQEEPTINRAIDIRNGIIENQNILLFQRRKREYPYSFE
jgi:N5-(carboxyethyl)ornithine synthase